MRVLRDHLLRAITDHRIPIGSRLPSETALMKQFSLSRTSVRQVMMELSAKGLIERRQGKGTFLVDRTSRLTKTSRSMLVGVWFNWPTGPLWGPVADGIREELDQWGYHAVFESGGFSLCDERRGIRSLLRKGLDGFIVAPSPEPNATHQPLGEMIDRGLPIVLVDMPVAGHQADLVCTNHELGA